MAESKQKLTRAQVVRLRRATDADLPALADEYGVHLTTARHAAKGLTYRSVSEPPMPPGRGSSPKVYTGGKWTLLLRLPTGVREQIERDASKRGESLAEWFRAAAQSRLETP